MADGVNDGDESDRLTVTWDLTAPRTPRETGDRDAAPVTHLAPDDAFLARRDTSDRHIWCRVPDDIVKLRAADPTLALRWRHAVRAVFTEAFAEGYVATGMSRDGWYTSPAPPRKAPHETRTRRSRPHRAALVTPSVPPSGP